MDSLATAGWLVAPWQIQVALGSGYTAYMAAYAGIRSHHQAIDTTFRALAFGLVATAILILVPAEYPAVAITGAFTASLIAGLLWRRFGGRMWERVLRQIDVSWGDDTPTAWQRLISDQDHYVTQISVLTADGRWFRCDDAGAVADLPNGPCILGTNGDIVLYPTHVVDTQGSRTVTVNDAHWGARATYLPASQIKQVNIRRTPVERQLSSEGGGGGDDT